MEELLKELEEAKAKDKAIEAWNRRAEEC